MKVSREAVLSALSNVIEPDLKKDIVTLGLVKILDMADDVISLEVKVSNPALHARVRMREACDFAIHRTLGKEWKVQTDVIPIRSDDRHGELRKVLPGVKNIIAVASGKGGVGKSTIAVNLAVGLAKKGNAVGLLDADIYGPSAPTMFDAVKEKPTIVEVDGRNLIRPIEQYGIKILSIGFFADVNQAVVWRGPMATKALNQLINDGHWGKLDYLIVDLPPGTGDVHLSIVQAIPLTGAVIVSTPQEVALADAKKGVAMFQLPAIHVPILGIVENMAWFTPEELPDNRYYLFGKDGAKNLAEDLHVPFLGHIPLIQSIRESGDAGHPAMLQENTITSGFLEEFLANFEQQMRMLPFRPKKKPETVPANG